MKLSRCLGLKANVGKRLGVWGLGFGKEKEAAGNSTGFAGGYSLGSPKPTPRRQTLNPKHYKSQAPKKA